MRKITFLKYKLTQLSHYLTVHSSLSYNINLQGNLIFAYFCLSLAREYFPCIIKSFTDFVLIIYGFIMLKCKTKFWFVYSKKNIS